MIYGFKACQHEAALSQGSENHMEISQMNLRVKVANWFQFARLSPLIGPKKQPAGMAGSTLSIDEMTLVVGRDNTGIGLYDPPATPGKAFGPKVG